VEGPERRGKPLAIGVGILVSLVVLLAGGWLYLRAEQEERERRQTLEQARAQCRQWADKLDQQTTETGVYVRWPGNVLPEKDPWGRDLLVDYAAGGVAETLTVRSLGPDGKSHTDDDLIEQRHSVNFKGVGLGIKKNAEETARNVGKGLVKGVVEGGREAVRGEKKPVKGN
jgi:hypothetical protein